MDLDRRESSRLRGSSLQRNYSVLLEMGVKNSPMGPVYAGLFLNKLRLGRPLSCWQLLRMELCALRRRTAL